MLRRTTLLRTKHRRGQAMVELALSITFILFLASAAVDLALVFKTQQALTNAVAEASSYLAELPLAPVSFQNETVAQRKARANQEAAQHLRFEAAEDDGELRYIGSMRDLDSNGEDDLTQSPALFGGSTWNASLPGWLQIIEVDDSVLVDGTTYSSFDGLSGGMAACANRTRITSTGSRCYVVVRAQKIYKPFFVLAPFLGDEVTVRAFSIKPFSTAR